MSYSVQCEFGTVDLYAFEDLRKYIYDLHGAIVSDGEGGHITICPICKNDGLKIDDYR